MAASSLSMKMYCFSSSSSSSSYLSCGSQARLLPFGGGGGPTSLCRLQCHLGHPQNSIFSRTEFATKTLFTTKVAANSTSSAFVTAASATDVTARIIDGKATAKDVREEITIEISRMKDAIGIVPGLAVILVGDRKDSATYVRNKKKACESVGINSYEVNLPETATEEEVLKFISDFNDDPAVHGILVQLPLPSVCLSIVFDSVKLSNSLFHNYHDIEVKSYSVMREWIVTHHYRQMEDKRYNQYSQGSTRESQLQSRTRARPLCINDNLDVCITI